MTRFRPLFRPAARAVLILAAALSLAGCGRRGPLEAPPGAADTGAPLTGAPDAVPLPRNAEVAPIDAATTAPNTNALGQPVAAGPAAPATKGPRKTFPLDPLL